MSHSEIEYICITVVVCFMKDIFALASPAKTITVCLFQLKSSPEARTPRFYLLKEPEGTDLVAPKQDISEIGLRCGLELSGAKPLLFPPSFFHTLVFHTLSQTHK